MVAVPTHLGAGSYVPAAIDTGDTAWLLVASALVLLMTPGLAFFYGGLVRGRNVVSTIMLSFISIAVVSIVWVLWGYSLAFGDGNAYIGDLTALGLVGIGIDAESGTIPTLLFVVFHDVRYHHPRPYHRGVCRTV
jgi:Amt family ammonium transporter